jgi:hypothetical protein
VADERTYWNWRDALMKHPEGRATGGEPCVKCGQPVPANAHWKWRDRHVCSPRCNRNLNRQFNRLKHKAEEGGPAEWRGRALHRPPAAANPRSSGPRHFATVANAEAPYEWEGYCPLPGDTVERHGIVTRYSVLCLYPRVPDIHTFGGALYIAIAPSGHQDVWAANELGELRWLRWGSFTPEGKRFEGEFDCLGTPARWSLEFISDVTPGGLEYRWRAPVAVPSSANHLRAFWSPAYTALSERRRRISEQTARHVRRMRKGRKGSEKFDPYEIYERDGWICMICGQAVNKSLQWPDEMSASLDHTIPLVAGGLHTRENTQLAHFICNIRKGAAVGEISPAPPALSTARTRH